MIVIVRWSRPGQCPVRRSPAGGVPTSSPSPPTFPPRTDVNSSDPPKGLPCPPVRDHLPTNGQAGGSAGRYRRSSGFHQDIGRYGNYIFPGRSIAFICIVREAGWIEQKDGIFPGYGSRDRLRDGVRMFREACFTTRYSYPTGRKSCDLPGNNLSHHPRKSANRHTGFTTVHLHDPTTVVPVVPGRVCPGE
jgi:hypothetical protein